MLATKRVKLLFGAILLMCVSTAALAAKPSYYYQLKIYHLKTKSQVLAVDAYLKGAYLPALHRAGIQKVGVFKPVVADTAEQLIYVFVPFKKMDDFLGLDEKLAKDGAYLSAGAAYLQAKYTDAPYVRIENVLLKAFSAMPAFAVPNLTGAKSERVYELRSYEAATEQLSLNKIEMFNLHELKIFTDLNFNAVFYGQVIAGSKMPNLMYLTTFNNKADRDQHWKDFGPAYKKINGLPQYQNNVSKNVTLFLYPVDYSDL
jgi:hypothetical protein